MQSSESQPTTTGMPSFRATLINSAWASAMRIPLPALNTGRSAFRMRSMMARAVSSVTFGGITCRYSPWAALSSGISWLFAAVPSAVVTSLITQPVPPAR